MDHDLGFSMAGKGPRCDVFTGGSEGVNDIFADPKGNLIVPLGSPRTVNVYHGPNMCGPKAGSFSDPYGQPSDSASLNALKGTIAVANIVGSGSGAGNIAICTLKERLHERTDEPQHHRIRRRGCDGQERRLLGHVRWRI